MRWFLHVALVYSITSVVLGYELPHIIAPESPLPRLDSRLAKLARSHAKKVPVRLQRGKDARDGEVVVIVEPPPGQGSAGIDVGALRALGGKVLAQSKHLARVAIPIENLEAASRIVGVNFLRLPFRPLSNVVVSEGVPLIGADEYHTNGLRGSGVDVAIIDEGFSRADDLGSDMPSTWQYRDFTRRGMYLGGPHGTACAEIIHDIAPEAELHLLRIDDLVDLENAKDYCIENGIDVISHSMSWLGTGFGDGRGLTCDIVDDAEEKGILWVNSAGNYAKRQYSALWRDSNASGWLDFSGPEDEVLLLEEAAVGDTIEVWLTWNDWPTSSENYDLYLYKMNDSGEIEKVEESTTVQSGSHPIEAIEYPVREDGIYGAAIWKDPDARGTVVKLWSGHHDLTEYASLIGNIGTPADAAGSFSVGAAAYFDWRTGRIAPYSSKGPTADGRIKPNIVAPTQVRTASFPGFGGTSGAAPHAAGAAALLLSGDPNQTLQQLRLALTENARDLGSPGKDNTFGNGLLTLPAPPRFDTALRTSWDGYWAVEDGEIRARENTWRFTHYTTTAGEVVVHGVANVTITNETDQTQRMNFNLAFLDAGESELADRYVPLENEITLSSGQSRQLRVEFEAGFSSLAIATQVARVTFFGSFTRILDPPVAAFSASPTRGGAPLTVHFTNRSTGIIGSNLWRFGNGALSSVENPTYTYTDPGDYTVTLRVANPGGEDTISRTVTVTAPPEAHLLVRATIGSRRYNAPLKAIANRRVKFEVLKYTRTDMGDSISVDEFVVTVPSILGTLIADGEIRVSTVAGRKGNVTISAEGVVATFPLEIIPSSIDHLVIEPSVATVSPGQRIDFNARGVDRFGNIFNVVGANLGWHCVPSSIGIIDSRTGIFTAGEGAGVGYIIAVVSRSLRFGDSEASANRSVKIVVASATPTQFALHQNHPNPFNPETIIRFDLPHTTWVRLTVYNLVGQSVASLVDQVMEKGNHEVVWRPAGPPAGIYIYRLESDGFEEARKMLLLH
jgi:PKD repeat protein